jgi:Mannosyltransferase (PIG-V)
MRRDGTQAATVWDRGLRAPARSRLRARGAAAPWHALWVSRLLVWAAGAAATAALGLSARADTFDPGEVTRPYGSLGDALVAPFARWDSVWYLAIANDGYPEGDVRRAAFFPLYPLLVRAVDTVTGAPVLAGALVSLACFAAALVLLHRLTALELGPAAAGPAVWALALFPGAFAFSAVLSEALYLALSVGCLYAARTGRWAWAGAAGALAAATRSAGILLVVPLILLWLAARRRGGGRSSEGAWIALVPLGPAAFAAALALGGGDPLAPLHAQDAWHRTFAWPFAAIADGTVAAWDGLGHLSDPAARHDVVLFVFLALAVPAVAGVLRRLPPAYGAYVVCALALPLSFPVGPQPLMSLPRFLAVLFPLFMWLGLWLSEGGRARRMAVLVPSAAGLAAASAVVATWHWFA